MDYQFSRDDNAGAIAEFSMGAEAFGRWFCEELGNDKNKIDNLLQVITQLESRQLKKYQLNGPEFILNLNSDEVEVYSKTLDVEALDELPEGTELYDQESLAGCGLADFKQVLCSWQEFIGA